MIINMAVNVLQLLSIIPNNNFLLVATCRPLFMAEPLLAQMEPNYLIFFLENLMLDLKKLH